MRLGRMLQAVDLHAAGEPGRVIVGGVIREGQRARARQIIQQVVDSTRVPN